MCLMSSLCMLVKVLVIALELVLVAGCTGYTYDGTCTIVRNDNDFTEWSDDFMVLQPGDTLEAVCRCNLEAPMWSVRTVNGTNLLLWQNQPATYCVGPNCSQNMAFLPQVVPGRYVQKNLTHTVTETVILQCVHYPAYGFTMEHSDKIVVSVPNDPVSCSPLQLSSSMAPSPSPSPSPSPELSPSPSYSDEFVTSSLPPPESSSSTLATPTITRDTCSNVTVVITHTVTVSSNSTSRRGTVVPTADVNAAERIVDGITAEGTVSIAVVLLAISIVFFVVIIVLVILLRRSRSTSSGAPTGSDSQTAYKNDHADDHYSKSSTA